MSATSRKICVAPEYRGRGLGRLLMVECSLSLARRGFSLPDAHRHRLESQSVSLYEWLGFKGAHRFDAMVWGRKPKKGVSANPWN